MEKRILGLDPGLAILGFGTICYQVENSLALDSSDSNTLTAKIVNKSVNLLDFGVIKTAANVEMVSVFALFTKT